MEEIIIGVLLETLMDASLETIRFIHIFIGDSEIFIGGSMFLFETPILVGDLQIFIEDPQNLVVFNKIMGVCNENMGSPSRILGYSNEMKICRSPTRIWGSPRRSSIFNSES